MSENIQIRRRGGTVTHVRIRAASVDEVLSKLSACVTANPRDEALAAIAKPRSRVDIHADDTQGWWIVRPRA
jgi:hypothetical protein